MSMHDMTRRAFLAAATTTAVLTGCATGNPKPNTAKVVPGKLSPNEKLNVAGIGVGGKGTQDILSFSRENVVAICDVDLGHAEETIYRLPKAKQYQDYRKMLDEMGGQIDAVTVTTPDHTHAPAAYMAMKLGKHVYVQKPLTHTIAEARLLQKVAKEMNVVTQMGNQGHSGNGVREMCEIIWSGAIGQVKEVHCWTNRPIWPQGIADPLPEQPVREKLDWDLWIGSAPSRPFNKDYAPFNWRGWWDFGCGAIGDMACHIMDAPIWALHLDQAESYSCEPISVEGLTGQCAPMKSKLKFEIPARGDMAPVTLYWYDGGNLPERPAGIPDNEPLGDEDGKNGSLLIGTDGIATTGTYGDGTRLLPAERMKDFKKPDETIPRAPGNNHYRDFVEAVKNGTKAGSNFDYAVPMTQLANFGNVALRAGKKLEFNRIECKVTNDEAANALLTKQYRKGWELPV